MPGLQGVQPWALLIAFLGTTFFFLNNGIKLKKSELLFIIVGILCLIFGLLTLRYSTIGYSVSMIAPAIYILALNRSILSPSPALLSFFIIIYFIGVIIYLINDSLYQSLNLFLLQQHRIEASLIKGSGIANFAPEAGLSGAVLSCILLAFINHAKRVSSPASILILGIGIFCLAATKSGTGYLFAILIIFFFYLKANLGLKVLFIMVIPFIFIILDIREFLSNYGVSQVYSLLTFSLERDSSIYIRILNLLSGIDNLNTFGILERMLFDNDEIIMLNPGFATSIARIIYGSGMLGVFYLFSYILFLKIDMSPRTAILMISLVILVPISFPSALFLYKGFSSK